MFSVRYTGCPRVQEAPIESPALKPDVSAVVEKLWSEAQSERSGALYNGLIFNVTDFAWPLIRGHFIDYKIFIAAQRRPDLFSKQRVRPLGVTGVSRCGDGIILGRRSDLVTQDRGLWELVPSGGLDVSSREVDGSINITGQFVQEFNEETGLLSEMISEIRPSHVVEDMSTHVFDIIATLDLNASSEDTERLLSRTRTDEYQEFKVLKPHDIAAFLEARPDQIAPLSRYLICDLEPSFEVPA
jgi:hypothetical protein